MVGGFPLPSASNVESVSMPWCHHETYHIRPTLDGIKFQPRLDTLTAMSEILLSLYIYMYQYDMNSATMNFMGLIIHEHMHKSFLYVRNSNHDAKNKMKLQLTRYSLKPNSPHDADFVITDGTMDCRYGNPQCHQWWQNWHHDNSQFSVLE